MNIHEIFHGYSPKGEKIIQLDHGLTLTASPSNVLPTSGPRVPVHLSLAPTVNPVRDFFRIPRGGAVAIGSSC